MNTSVSPLNAINEDDLFHFGGKASNLAILLKKGFNVPYGIGLSKKVFERFLELSGLDISSIRRVHTLAMISLDSVLNDCYEWQNTILDTIETKPFPSELSKKITSLLDESSFYAVRSSCISEDSASTSFAGQYVSILNVKGKDEILSAIKKCWTSQYNKRGSDYSLTHKGMPILSPSMGVVIQKMIASNFAGVCFTAGPTPKTSELAIIEYVDCIGEALVSGEKTPSHIEIDKLDQFKKTINSKSNQHVLSDELILKLLADCREIEKQFGSPQDIEWAIANNEIFILQTRPITVLGKDIIKKEAKQKLFFSHTTTELQSELHDLVLSQIDISGFRAANYFLSKQNEHGYWSNPEIPEWDVVGTAEAIQLLAEGGIPYNLVWQDSMKNREKEYGISFAQNWLLHKSNSDNYWGTDLWDTCQVLISLINSGLSLEHEKIKKGIAYVKSQFEKELSDSQEKEWYGAAFLASASKLFSLVGENTECTKCVQSLKNYQNPDGNFFINTIHNQSVPSEWHTAQVISALRLFNNDDEINTMINKACNWLATRQHKEGSWGVKNGIYSLFNITFTSYSIMALNDSGNGYKDEISKAIKWIKSKQTLNGSFGDVWSTLMAITAIQKVNGTLFSFSIPLPMYAKLLQALSNKKN